MACIWLCSDHRPLLPRENILWLHWLQMRKTVSCILKEKSVYSWQKCLLASLVSQWMITRYPQMLNSLEINTWGCEGQGHSRWEQSDQGSPRWWWDRSPGTAGRGGISTVADEWVLWEQTVSALLHSLFPCPHWMSLRMRNEWWLSHRIHKNQWSQILGSRI